VLMLAGRYLAHAAISNTLHLAIPSAIQAPQADGHVPPGLAGA
jgi:hypothetical protein